MPTINLLSLDQKLLENIGDYKSHLVTTDINADNSIVSTHLTNYRNTTDYFNGYWLYIEDKANAGENRQVSDDDGSNTLTLRGAALTDDTANTATFRLSRYSWESRKLAIIETIREIYPKLYLPLDTHTLVVGNMLPNSHFEDWAVSTAPDNYTMQDSNITATALTTAGLIRGGAKSMNAVTGAGGAGKYVYITSNDYPRLLDLMNQTVSFKCWVYPEAADDAKIEIYTLKADGTAQTLTSTTTCPADKWTLLELEDQSLNDDLVEIQFRFKITTASKYVYFDAARATGKNVFEYLLSIDYRDGAVHEVWIQLQGYSDDICDDLQPRHWDRIHDYQILDNGSDKFLRLPELYSDKRLLRLIGNKPLETLSAATDTISLSGEKLNLLIAYAKYKLYQLVPGVPASEDIGRFDSAQAKALFEYNQLSHLRMPRQPRMLRVRTL